MLLSATRSVRVGRMASSGHCHRLPVLVDTDHAACLGPRAMD